MVRTIFHQTDIRERALLCERFVHKASYSESEWLPFEALPIKINRGIKIMHSQLEYNN